MLDYIFELNCKLKFDGLFSTCIVFSIAVDSDGHTVLTWAKKLCPKKFSKLSSKYFLGNEWAISYKISISVLLRGQSHQ